MNPAPKRRWFAFSLRTVFAAVTVFACLVGWIVYNLNWIRQRHHEFSITAVGIWRLPDWNSKAPGMLWLFGEESHSLIGVYFEDPHAPTPQEEAEAERRTRMFPEAKVDVRTPLWSEGRQWRKLDPARVAK
ncbi:MAG: hypothetical protein AB7E98_19875 [Pirellulales bacterium]